MPLKQSGYFLDVVNKAQQMKVKPASHCLTDWRIGWKIGQWENLRRGGGGNNNRRFGSSVT